MAAKRRQTPKRKTSSPGASRTKRAGGKTARTAGAKHGRTSMPGKGSSASAGAQSPARAAKKKRPTKTTRPPRSHVTATKTTASDSTLWGRFAQTQEHDTGTGRIRLNQYMAQCGVASRRASDELIEQGRVTVNGDVIKELGSRIDPLRDRVVVDDVVLRPERATYVLLHKPAGVICTNATREKKPRAIDLVSSVKGRLFSVGRLDVDSEGLLILTNDGQFADRMTHPRYGVPKRYDVVVRGRVEPEKLDKLRGGVWLAEGRTQGARIRIKRRGAERSYISVEIREGKNREVRRMFSRIGYPVIRLKRTSIGPLTIRGLGKGKFRFITKAEVEALLEAASRTSDDIEELGSDLATRESTRRASRTRR